MIMLALSASTFTTLTPARANTAPAPGNPGTRWVPAGPMVDRLRFQIYSDSAAEFNDFQSSTSGTGLDIADALVPAGLLNGFQTDTRVLMTTPVQQYNVYGLDFNMLNNFWGVPFRSGDDPTRLSIHIRQGIAHLISRTGFIINVLGGKGDRADCFTPRLQIVKSGILCPLPSEPPIPFNGDIPRWDMCSFDTLVLTPRYPPCQSAYYLGSQSDATGVVNVGSPDFCAAADHFIAAGLATAKNADCTLTNHLVGQALTQTLTLGVPFTESGRKARALGDAFTSAINTLMGPHAVPAVVECGASSSGLDGVLGADSHFVAPAVAGGPGGGPSPPDYKDLLESLGKSNFQISTALCPNWDMAALGWNLSQNVDQFYTIYNSKFAFNSYFNRDFDRWTSMLEFNTSQTCGPVPCYVLSAQSAEYILGADAVNIPVWSDAGQFVYLNGWTNVVNRRV